MPIMIPPSLLKVAIMSAATLGVGAAKEVIGKLNACLVAAQKPLNELNKQGAELSQSLQPKGAKFTTASVAPIEPDKDTPSSRPRR